MSTLAKEIPTTGSPTLAVRGTGRGPRGVAVLLGPPIAFLALVVVLWYIVSALLGKLSFLLPAPHRIFTEAFFDPKVAGDIGNALVQTVLVTLAGLVLAIVIGVVWAIAMSQAKAIERTLYPYAVILQCIPILALVPLIGFWFGQEFFARMIVSVLIALFPMVSNTLFGLQGVDKSQRELFKLQGASRWTILTKLQLPAAMPTIFAGMRISAGLALVGAIVGDFFFRRGTPGIGSLISNYTARLQGPELFAAILSAAFLGVAIFVVFGWLSKAAVGKWYESAS
ncbi:ABC transporter permease [Naasia aerilata]|uniref:Nitrate ABC transporter permease n=1 Tax=Naasia aerilata TaxID=1162966 RepID=A0ABN6XL62_9MICO|nr:ABC transporter permease [Naasia aerilata]BDZ45673.1 nitrate ABC transporter permease [Naasia aerilata]